MRPWFGPGDCTIFLLARRPHPHIGGVRFISELDVESRELFLEFWMSDGVPETPDNAYPGGVGTLNTESFVALDFIVDDPVNFALV